MIKKVLIANRGEIAVRIIRALKAMSIKSVSVYSLADKDGLWTQLADEKICIGSAKANESYLNINNLISAALYTHCDAIHPGVGFLSESSLFAEAVENSGLIFIGPNKDTINLLGNKVEARILAKKAGLDVTPGSFKEIDSVEELKAIAEDIGYPIILKASLGGGGKGMRVIYNENDLEKNFTIAKEEANKFFANPAIHVEKFLTAPRHIEIQLLSDGKNVVFLGERDCSVQKNHQKLIEESPSNVVTEELREQLKEASIKLFKMIEYKGAGTIEFLLEKNKCYFMEVNARVQVEHPVSEFVSSIDIIKEMILISSGKTSNNMLSSPSLNNHSMEVRINALSCGKINKFNPPLGPSVRVDTHIYSGFTVSPFYDSLLAKIIVYTQNRQESIKTMLACLSELEIEGIKTNKDVIVKILKNKKFVSGKFDTSLYQEIEKEL
ncbi:MAG: acetyl-CoA carboxylase biotin carboxylase subunit [Pleomorphochaeta sp.]